MHDVMQQQQQQVRLRMRTSIANEKRDAAMIMKACVWWGAGYCMVDITPYRHCLPAD